ncbi:MAG: hypothetical protein IKB18_00610 [Tidjanibacter sp.]|nr:hypothetical protein [Tidjanibacter sp.]
MKKFLHIALLIGAVSALMCSCEKGPKTDGKAEFASFVITAEANPTLELDRDYAAVINHVEGTVLVALPELPKDVEPNALVPTFTLTTDDVASVDGTPIVSGEWVLDLSGDDASVVVKVEDVVSMVSKEYTLTTATTDGIAGMVSAGIYVAKNEGKVTYDITAAPGADGVATLSVSAPLTEVVMSVETSLDDVVTFNGQEGTHEPVWNSKGIETETWWTATVDFSFPVDIVVTDAKAGIVKKYVVKSVNDTYRASWSKVGSIAELPRAEYAMDIDPVTGDLYVAHTETSTVNDVTDDRLTVKKWDGSKFVTVGEPAFSAKRATYITLAARGGKVYAMYTDNAVSSKLTVMMYDGTAWKMIGAQGEMEKHTGLSNWRTPIEVTPDGKLFAATTASADLTNYGVVKRGLHVGIWDGSAWSHVGSVAGRAADQMTYLNRLAVAGNDLYLMCANQNEKTTSVYKYSAGAWTCVVNEYKMDERATEIATYFGTMKGFANGDVYFALGEMVYGAGSWYLQLFKLVGNTLERVGEPIKENQNSSAAFDFEFDAKGQPIIMYRDNAGAEHMKVTTIDADTQTWCYPADLGESSYGGYPAYMQKDTKGDIYATFIKQNQKLDEAGKTVKTYEVVLYKKVK